MMVRVAVATAIALFAISANASPVYTFQTLDNPDDPAFHQMLGIDSLASPTLVGYFGDGTIVGRIPIGDAGVLLRREFPWVDTNASNRDRPE
jgi:hypothetical protein